MKHIFENRKRTILTAVGVVFFLVVIITPFLVGVSEVSAVAGVPVTDAERIAQAKGLNFEEKIRDKLWKAIKKAAAVAFKNSLKNYLSTLAQDTATKIATGGKGQTPMFDTRTIGELWSDTVDDAGGFFLEAVGESLWGDQFSICDPSFSVKLQIGLGLQHGFRPEKPECTWSQAMNAWDNYDYGKIFQSGLDPWQNELGSALTLHTGLLEQTAKGLTLALIERQTTQGWLDVGTTIGNSLGLDKLGLGSRIVGNTKEKQNDLRKQREKDAKEAAGRQAQYDCYQKDDGCTNEEAKRLTENYTKQIADEMENLGVTGKAEFIQDDNYEGKIKMPSTTVKSVIEDTTKGLTEEALNYTQEALADAISVFTSTLVGKWIDQLLNKGLVEPGSGSSSTYEIYDVTSSGSYASSPKKQAEEKFAKVFEPEFITSGPYDLLALLSSCPDRKNHGVDECAIDQDFRAAIEQKLTVGQALEQGLLQGDLPLGFTSTGQEPEFDQGYPYRSLIILRKYRVIPVGWEIAAQYIKLSSERGQSSSSTQVTLKMLADSFDNFDSPYYGLVDPGWVLKAPAQECLKQGYGPQILSSQVKVGIDADGDGTYTSENDTPPSLEVMRADNYCADSVGCLEEDGNGNCLHYGYCTEENRIWNFQGAKSCEEQYNTCLAFTDSDGEINGFLQNSLDYNSCTADNAGCLWYCQDYNAVDSAWKCTEPEKVLATCWTYGGCTMVDPDDSAQSCAIPYGGVHCYTSEGTELFYSSPTVNTRADMYFDSGVAACDENDAGCSEFIRLKAGLGINLIKNPSFEMYPDTVDLTTSGFIDVLEDYGWSITNDITYWFELVSDAFSGNAGLRLDADTLLQSEVETGVPLANRTFALSLYAKNSDTLDCKGEFRISGVTAGSFESSADWKNYSAVYTFPANNTLTALVVEFEAEPGAECIIDAIKLEEGSSATSFTEYGDGSETYLSKAPEYYSCAGYTTILYDEDNDTQEECEKNRHYWRTDISQCVESGSSVCGEYALQCSSEEVGCAYYRPVNGDPELGGKVSQNDYCPAECAGYDTFKESAANFSEEHFPTYFIPSTAKQCDVQSAGCEEFTNLDEVARGGEGREYYTYIRQCQKPDESVCATYYTWVGSENSGYQLQTYSLREDQTTGDPEAITNPHLLVSGDCEDLDDAINNPECKQFFDDEGGVHYAFFNNTITCSDECQPYRKTIIETAVDSSNNPIASESACSNYDGDLISEEDEDGNWSNDLSECLLCSRYGGELRNKADGITGNEECIFQTIPSQGITCSAEVNGCREYKGNASSNVYEVLSENFEGSTEKWYSLYGRLSTESTVVGGHSWYADGGKIGLNFCGLASACADENGCACESETLDCTVENGQQYCGLTEEVFEPQNTYLISFWLKPKTSTAKELQLGLEDKNGSKIEYEFGKVKPSSSDWQKYTVGPIFFNPGSSITPANIFVFKQKNEEFFMDNISIRQVSDYVYAVKDSWNTPSVCDEDPNGVSSPQYMLGCQEYEDAEGESVYLKSFTNLCRDEVIGCEAFLDTQNSNSPFLETYNKGNSGEIDVPEDEIIYLVNDSSKSCPSTSAGCTSYGLPTIDEDGNVSSYETVYYVNDPDSYGTSLCSAEEVYCSEYTSSSGSVYEFKDPGYAVCDYRAEGGGWYKLGSVSSEPDCPVVESQLGIEYPAPGVCEGGMRDGLGCRADADCDGAVCDLGQHLAGRCNTEMSSCTEYIDPVSEIAKNVLYNPGFEQNIDSIVNVPDGWKKDSPGSGSVSYEQGSGVKESNAVQVQNDSLLLNELVELEAETLYTISGYAKKVNSSSQNTISFELIDCVNSNNNPAQLSSPDGSVNIIPNDTNTATEAVLAIDDSVLSANDYTRVSGRVYSEELVYCTWKLETSDTNGYLFDEVGFQETGVYYKLGDTVDKSSCSGTVNPDEGCVLFNDRSWVDYSGDQSSDKEYLDYLVYDADMSPNESGGPSIGCQNDGIWNSEENRYGLCDSVDVIKVNQDRECQEWLYCKSTAMITDQEGKEVEMCLQRGKCSSLDENGLCDDFPLEEKEMLTLSKANVEEMRDLSGYSKVGFDWGGGMREDGYYAFSQMLERGGTINIPNGGFEEFFEGGQPVSWMEEDEWQWEDTYFKVIADPKSYQDEFGDATDLMAPEGGAFLRVNGNYHASSELVDAFADTEYIVSGFINTERLEAGDAKVRLSEYNNEGLIISSGYFDTLVLGSGKDWTYLTQKFLTSQNTAKIKVRLVAWNDSEGDGTSDVKGKFYYDDLQINPVLEHRDSSKTYTGQLDLLPYLTQSCRLFPKEDSLSCEQRDESGVIYKGWRGYCLDADSQNPDYCLLWWPVDYVSGDYPDANAGYSDRTPLYYCLQAEDEAFTTDTITLNGNGKNFNTLVLGENIPLDSSRTIYKDQINEIIFHFTKYGISGGSVCDDYPTGVVDNMISNSIDLSMGDDGSGSASAWTVFIDGYQLWYDYFSDRGKPGTIDCPPTSPSYEECTTERTYTEDTWRNGEIKDSNNGMCPDYIALAANFEQGTDRLVGFDYGLLDSAQGNSTVDFTIEMQLKPICTELSQVVTNSGVNKAWSSRASSGSTYAVPDLNYTFDVDYQPFGSIVPPAPADNPQNWDSRDTQEYLQPLYAEPPDTSLSKPYQVRAGSPYSCDSQGGCVIPEGATVSLDSINDGIERLKRLFVSSYGTWQWRVQGRECVGGVNNGLECTDDTSCPDGVCQPLESYTPVSGYDWVPPIQNCAGNSRPSTYPNDYCGVSPIVDNITINGSTGDVIEVEENYANFSFTSDIDDEQLPLKALQVDWGDGEKLTVSGLRSDDRPSKDDPHTFTHLYSYWDLVKKYNESVAGVECGVSGTYTACGSSACCRVQPKVQVIDNWGWCNSNSATQGYYGAACNSSSAWKSYGGFLYIKETQ